MFLFIHIYTNNTTYVHIYVDMDVMFVHLLICLIYLVYLCMYEYMRSHLFMPSYMSVYMYMYLVIPKLSVALKGSYRFSSCAGSILWPHWSPSSSVPGSPSLPLQVTQT